MKLNVIHTIALLLVIIGALNWGLIGGFEFNAVETVLGTGMLTRIVYAVVGVAGLLVLFTSFINKK